MDLLRIYYYASMPLLTCNILYYSLTALSASIVSTQNVSKFIYEHPLSDTIIFKREMEQMDLHTKLKIVEALIYDIIRTHCDTDEEYEMIKHDMSTRDNSKTIGIAEDKENDILLVDIKYKIQAFEKMKQPVRISLVSLSDTVQQVNKAIENIKDKIVKHNKSYFRSVSTINLQEEIELLKKYGQLLDTRLHMFMELLKVYKIC